MYYIHINVLYTSTLTVYHSLHLHTFNLKKRLSGIKLAEGTFHHEFQSFCIVITPINTFPRYKLARDSVFHNYELHMRIHCDQPSPSFFQNNNATMLRKSAALKNCNDAQSSKLKQVQGIQMPPLTTYYRYTKPTHVDGHYRNLKADLLLWSHVLISSHFCTTTAIIPILPQLLTQQHIQA